MSEQMRLDGTWADDTLRRCNVEGCERTNLMGRGYCAPHYRRAHKDGFVTAPTLYPRCGDCGLHDVSRVGAFCDTCASARQIAQRRKNYSAGGMCRNCSAVPVNRKGSYCESCRMDAEVIYQRRHRLRPYNMTPEQYDQMLADQNDCCAWCEIPIADYRAQSGKWFAVDHDHACCPESGKSCGGCVRALVCHKCNLAAGHFQDNLSAVSRYFWTVKAMRMADEAAA